MAIRRLFPVGKQQTYTASGPISIDLTTIPGTITELILKVQTTQTTTASPGTYQDPDDRIISNIQVAAGTSTFATFTDMRSAQHFTRRQLRGAAPKRAGAEAASTTAGVRNFLYVFHWGTCPWKIDRASSRCYYDPYDLSAGIPPDLVKSLNLSGNYAANNTPGSGYTVVSATVIPYAQVVIPEAGDQYADYLPKGIPLWSMQNPAQSATSSALSQSIEVPGADFLYSAFLMATLGSTAPRSDSMLNSLGLQWNDGRQIETYNEADTASMVSQLGFDGWPPSADPNATDAISPAVTQVVDPGLYELAAYKHANGPGASSLFGAQLPPDTGALLIPYGVASVSGGATLSALFQKYRPYSSPAAASTPLATPAGGQVRLLGQ